MLAPVLVRRAASATATSNARHVLPARSFRVLPSEESTLTSCVLVFSWTTIAASTTTRNVSAMVYPRSQQRAPHILRLQLVICCHFEQEILLAPR